MNALKGILYATTLIAGLGLYGCGKSNTAESSPSRVDTVDEDKRSGMDKFLGRHKGNTPSLGDTAINHFGMTYVKTSQLRAYAQPLFCGFQDMDGDGIADIVIIQRSTDTDKRNCLEVQVIRNDLPQVGLENQLAPKR